MSDTSIEWVKNSDGSQGKTWNPVRGCSRISEGCRNCYAERQAARDLPGMKSPTTGKPFAIMTPSGPRWTGKVELIPHMLDIPLRRKVPTTYFVNSMSDLFHEALPDEAIDKVFSVMALCPQHTFQVLTKRAERMREYLAGDKLKSRLAERAFDYIGPSISTDADVQRWCDQNGVKRKFRDHLRDVICDLGGFHFLRYTGWPLPNVWLGVSVEDRANLKRIDLLRQTPAAVRFLSLEPLLEDLGILDLRGVDLVIVGGESGPGARPCDLAWIRFIVAQCKAAGVPVFVKQLGTRPYDGVEFGTARPPDTVDRLRFIKLQNAKGGDPAEWEPGLRVREMPGVATPAAASAASATVGQGETNSQGGGK